MPYELNILLHQFESIIKKKGKNIVTQIVFSSLTEYYGVKFPEFL